MNDKAERTDDTPPPGQAEATRAADEGKDDAELWAELDRQEAAAAPADDQSAAEAASDARADADFGAAADAAEASAEDKPAAEPAKGEAKADDKADDPWSTATPAQREAWTAAQQRIQRLEQADRSQRGRLSALQKQINDLLSRGAQAAGPQQGAAAGGKAEKGGEGDASEFLKSDDWKSFSDEYPEVAAPLTKVVGSLQAHVTRLEKTLQAVGEDRQKAALAEQATLLADEHPDWERVAADPGFVNWLQAQPRHIQEAAYRNANEIVDAAEAADVVGRFKAFRSAQPGSAPQQNNAAGASRADTGNRLDSRRQRQLASASAARSRGPSAANGIPEDGDPEVLWKMMDEEERRRQRA